jgi:cytochrome c-type biogenesis protein CcmF
MLADIGHVTVIAAFAVAVYAVVVSIYGNWKNDWRWVESARNASIAILGLVMLACVLLVTALLQGDFSIEYVWRVSSREMPTYLKVTALWGGQAGSLLFWNMILAVFTATAMAHKWHNEHERYLLPHALAVATVTQVFFLGLTAFVENPFTQLAFTPADGNGLNPLLRHPGMIIHPPMLYLGFTGLTIPYAFAMAALITGKLDEGWIRITRRWTLAGWLFLSLGLILGGRWAYDVLGWGGYWDWDPVENASLMPWLAGTAFLHSVMIQEKRSMFRMWNMFLIILTYCLMIYGTFIVRSGVISSVHSFAQSAVGPLFFGFIGLMFVFSAYWLIRRREELASENRLDSFLSREAAFLFNNFVILAILGATFWGTNLPIVSELVTGEKITVGSPFYEQVNGPLFAVLLLLMGVAPLTMWYRTSAARLGIMMRWPALAALVFVAILFFLGIGTWGSLLGLWIVMFAAIITALEFWRGTAARMRSKNEPVWVAYTNLLARNRRRYGGYWIHIGVIVMAFGIIGTEFFQQEIQINLNRGESVELGDYRMTFNGVRQYAGPDDLIITEASADLYHNERYVKTLYPRTEFYTRSGQPMSIPAARSTIGEDFYVLLILWEQTSSASAVFRIYLNPLINWVWAGGFIFVLGTMIAAWPDPVDQTVAAANVRRRRPSLAAGD